MCGDEDTHREIEWKGRYLMKEVDMTWCGWMMTDHARCWVPCLYQVSMFLKFPFLVKLDYIGIS